MATVVALAAPTARAYRWHNIYLEALFEADRKKVATRIRMAEMALANREHELCSIPNSAAEREALVTALDALHALKICLGFETTSAAAA